MGPKKTVFWPRQVFKNNLGTSKCFKVAQLVKIYTFWYQDQLDRTFRAELGGYVYCTGQNTQSGILDFYHER